MAISYLDSYRIERQLAEGGMGVVYQAVHTSLGRTVALKVLHPHIAAQPRALERFRREAEALARLEHPHAVRVYDFVAEPTAYLVMELVDGLSLADQLLFGGPLPFEQVHELALQVLDVLAAAHVRGIIHRDLKPGNLMLDRARAGVFVRVVDFGIAVLQEGQRERLTATGQLPGTADYMSPEQINSEPLDARSDLYSLACVLFELLTGRPPFPGASAAKVLTAHLFREPPRLEEVSEVRVPTGWQAALRKALAKERDARFATALDFRDALLAYKEGESRTPPPRPAPPPAIPEFIAAQVDDPPVCLAGPPPAPEERALLELTLSAIGARTVAHPGDAAVAVVAGVDAAACLKACAALRAEHPRVAVLLAGPEDDLGLMTRSIEHGVFDYLGRPLRESEVARKVVQALRSRRPR